MGIKIVERVDRYEDEGDMYVDSVIERQQAVPWWAPENFPRPDPSVYVPPPPPPPPSVSVVYSPPFIQPQLDQGPNRELLPPPRDLATTPPPVDPPQWIEDDQPLAPTIETLLGPDMGIQITEVMPVVGWGGPITLEEPMSILETLINVAAPVVLGAQIPNVPNVPVSPWDDLLNLGIDYLNQEYLSPNSSPPTTSIGGNMPTNLMPVTSTGAPIAKGWLYDPHTGKWIKRRKRRRRRIVTPTDLKDIAALKGILGGGKDFQTILATRGAY